MSAGTEASAAKSQTAAMEGGGFYNRHSAMQAAGVSLLLPYWEKVVREVDVGEGPLVIVDYGSSQGRNSLAPMRLAIEELRARTGQHTPVQVIHTDLPSNDYSALFATIEGDPDSYMAGNSNIFPSAVGRSYLQPIILPSSVHLGWNSWTMQWFDGDPIDAPDHVFAALSKSPAVHAAVRPRQASEWCRFLQARSTELRPGARLLTAFTGATTGETGWEWLGGEFWHAACDLERDGVLSCEERLHITLPTASRSIDDIRAPFGAIGTFAGLALEHAEILQVPDPLWAEFQTSGDARQFGLSHANAFRAWSGPTITRSLAGRADRAEVLDLLFGRFSARLASAPRPHQPYLAVAILAKRAR